MNEDNHSTTVLVTGASGYIAMHCSLQLLQQGYRVRGTLRSPARDKDLRATFARHVDAGDRLEFVTANLLSDEMWPEAVAGCQFVLHVASPTSEPKDEDEVIIPVRDDTLRVLQAAAGAGVQRVVMTSSVAAILRGHDPEEKVFTENDWSDADLPIGAYSKSKTLAERAAWEFVEKLPAGNALELATINPSFVIGPLLDEDQPISVEIVGKLMRRDVPGCPRLGFNLVDVRDVAAAHLLTMTAPQAAGKRFLCSAEHYWYQEIALILEKHFADRGYRIPTRAMPNFLTRIIALFDADVRRVVPTLGRRTRMSNERLRSTLGWMPRPIEEAIVDTAESLIEFGLIK